MTEWLPIDTYPYDGTWGLFRGGGINDLEYEQKFNPPFVVGKGYDADSFGLVIDIASRGAPVRQMSISYHGAAEWLPLSILDMIEPHQVTAARLMI